MCAQALGHESWASIQAKSFFSFWGHAARIVSYRVSPLSVVLKIRDTAWLEVHWRSHRRRLGYWPNAYRLIQLAWENLQEWGTPPYWDDAAQDKNVWNTFISHWLAEKSLLPLVYYPDLERVDLLGRSLLQIGEKFTLLPFRHVPVEEAYLSSFTCVPSPDNDSHQACVQVVSDGSHRSTVGGIAVGFLAPYALLEQAVIGQAKVAGPCTSTKAEILAAILALKMIRSALPYLGDIPVCYMTDSTFVLQVLEEACNFRCHPHDIHQLLDLWRQVCRRVSKQHVKGHSGHPLNSLVDVAARASLDFGHTRTLYRTADFRKVFLTLPQHNMPDFHRWM